MSNRIPRYVREGIVHLSNAPTGTTPLVLQGPHAFQAYVTLKTHVPSVFENAIEIEGSASPCVMSRASCSSYRGKKSCVAFIRCDKTLIGHELVTTLDNVDVPVIFVMDGTEYIPALQRILSHSLIVQCGMRAITYVPRLLRDRMFRNAKNVCGTYEVRDCLHSISLDSNVSLELSDLDILEGHVPTDWMDAMTESLVMYSTAVHTNNYKDICRHRKRRRISESVLTCTQRTMSLDTVMLVGTMSCIDRLTHLAQSGRMNQIFQLHRDADTKDKLSEMRAHLKRVVHMGHSIPTEKFSVRTERDQ